jgi:hypothetical protein
MIFFDVSPICLSGEFFQVMFVFPVSFLDVGITSLFHLFVESLLTSYLLFKFYNKADWDSIRLDMMNLLKDLTDMFNDTKCTANTMWNTFRDTLINSTSKNIPHKTAKINNVMISDAW